MKIVANFAAVAVAVDVDVVANVELSLDDFGVVVTFDNDD